MLISHSEQAQHSSSQPLFSHSSRQSSMLHQYQRAVLITPIFARSTQQTKFTTRRGVSESHFCSGALQQPPKATFTPTPSFLHLPHLVIRRGGFQEDGSPDRLPAFFPPSPPPLPPQTTNFLTATPKIYTHGAGVTAAAGTRLSLHLFLRNFFTIPSFE